MLKGRHTLGIVIFSIWYSKRHSDDVAGINKHIASPDTPTYRHHDFSKSPQINFSISEVTLPLLEPSHSAQNTPQNVRFERSKVLSSLVPDPISELPHSLLLQPNSRNMLVDSCKCIMVMRKRDIENLGF